MAMSGEDLIRHMAQDFSMFLVEMLALEDASADEFFDSWLEVDSVTPDIAKRLLEITIKNILGTIAFRDSSIAAGG